MVERGTVGTKRGLAQMLKGGVIMDVTSAEQAKIAEDAGAVSVMALERVPADIRAEGGVARMADLAKIDIEDVCGPEWAEWYLMTPLQRWEESQKLWSTYLALGGSLDPEPDTQSPFFDAEEWREMSADGGAGLRAVRRSGV
jgi:hypothetical protein